jgi:exonuclease III
VKITIITAYNASPSARDSTYYHQQLRVLSRLYQEQNNLADPDPRRQFMLGLQSWMKFLSQEGHKYILAMDANTAYDLDQIAHQQPLEYRNGSLTVSSEHDGKVATLVSTCNLCLPLAHQHKTRQFPASQITGKNQIDCILVSDSLLPAVQ